MWITPDGSVVMGDCPFGGRAATATEIAAWEAERAGSPAPQPISWMEFVRLFTPDEFAAIAVSNDPSVAAFRLLASGLGGDLNFADPRVAQGVDVLIAAGIVAAARRPAILSRTPA